ncbi:hypothetical protein E4T56_gene3937 [Termitomyces sp. T112]|nr:hypothetical protein E4T56_gene3937 [Termitomyces sp. T112]
MERIEEWHWLNPGQIVTGRLSSNTNPDPEQVAMQQLLIHEVMQQDITMGRALSKEERIEALERKLFALRQNGKKFDGVQVPRVAYQSVNDAPKATPSTSNTLATSSPSESTTAPAAKPADKGKAPERTIANEPLSVAKEPIAQPPIHPFLGIPSCYPPPLTGILLLPTELTTAHIKLCHPFMTSSNPRQFLNRNKFRTVVTPKQLFGASANMLQDPSDIFEDILLTFTIEEPQFLLGSNTDTANRLTSDKAPFASVEPVKAYIDSLPHREEPVVLTVAKDSQSLRTVMMLIDNKEEVECIHDSGSQIISMSAEIASNIGLSYDPNIVLNMQSANGTMDQLLGLARNTNPALAYLYTMASNISNSSLPPRSYLVSTDTYNPLILGQTLPFDTCVTDTTPTYVNIPFPAQYVTNDPPRQKGVQVKKKYKPVAMKTKPVASHVSEDFRIERQIIGDPLVTMPPLNPNLPPFIPTKRFTSKQQAKLVKDHNTRFLTGKEINVLVNMVAKQEKAFTWKDSERGSLRPDFFPPVHIPTIPHMPWVQHNRPIPPGLEKEKPGHFTQCCPLGLEVCYLSMAKQKELLMQLLAAKNVAGAPLPDKPMLQLTPEEINICMSPPELEEDF